MLKLLKLKLWKYLNFCFEIFKAHLFSTLLDKYIQSSPIQSHVDALTYSLAAII